MTVEKLSLLKEWEKKKITFAADEIPEENLRRTDPLVITVTVERKERNEKAKTSEELAINRTLVDTGSSVDILFYKAFKVMGYKDADMTLSTYNIHGFNKTTTKPKGEITMRILLGEIETQITLCIVDVESPYNMLLGRPWVHAIKGVASTLHQCLRFPIPSGIGEIKGDTRSAKVCNQIDVKNYEGRAKKRKDRWRIARELKKEEELRIYMIRAQEGKGIPSEIPEKKGEPTHKIKQPTPLGEPKANFTAAEPTKDINVGTKE
ncbi:uncharacterized protein LOC113316397 [Papaver somniferum]|uniref:uncharacterized protein LOC113316397 n=1 Tax=Papaver somniferum TaxID=3469 RepID=UPI000E70518D|nr:uncharacterized protein LOC113316397 [Papaver somniferum]